ncbi:MAG: peptide-methionine (S)-S-oxide reductase MsrA [Gemmatimonadaceae bacterium]
MNRYLFGAMILAVAACSKGESAQAFATPAKETLSRDTVALATQDNVVKARAESTVVAESPRPSGAKIDTAAFAGGCFWSMERPFQHVPGVVSTTVGYAGGHTKNPTYEEVNTRTTGHAETVQVVFDPSQVTYEKLLDVYWHNIDPVTRDRQFCDGGSDYRTVIFAYGTAQLSAANASKAALDKSGKLSRPIVTEVVAAGPFWEAEEYHQHFADRNPARYEAYRRGCGRDARLTEIWGAAAAPYVPHN